MKTTNFGLRVVWRTISRARSGAQAGAKLGRDYMAERREWQVPSGDGTQETWTQKGPSFPDREKPTTSLRLEDLNIGFPRKRLGSYARPQWRSW